MDSKYVLIVAVIIFISAYLMLTPGNQYERLQIAGSTSVQPVIEKLAEKYQETHPNVRINVQGGGSGLGIRTVEQGIVNMGMSSKALSKDEKNGLTEYIVGRDGIIIIVNNNNPITNLTSEQIRSLFSGEIENWNQINGSDMGVHVVVRESGSGTLQSFQDIIMIHTKIRKDAIVQSSTESVKQAIKQDPGAIGFISLANMDNTVKAIIVNGISPSAQNIANGSYLLQRPFEILMKGPPTGISKDFLDYVMGSEGQAIIQKQKIIPANQLKQ
ncbi:MAG: phosphate ABC transporter substrate-binding protein [Methanobacterium sp.]|nr:phosphate ABC transporter substrate-binding protein [Methanobacterium sp.]